MAGASLFKKVQGKDTLSSVEKEQMRQELRDNVMGLYKIEDLD